MEEKIYSIIFKVYVDLMKKCKMKKEYIRTYKLIYQLINKKYIVESYSLIRTLYEELLYYYAVTIDNKYTINIETTVAEIRDKVIKNYDILFCDIIDGRYIKDIYNYLSKMNHENTIKELLKDSLKNKKFDKFMKLNTMNILFVIGHMYLNYAYKGKEESKLIDYLIMISTYVSIKEIENLNLILSETEKERLSNYFVDLKDIKYVNKQNDFFKESMKKVDEVEFKNCMISIAQRVDELIENYGYKVFFNN